MSDQVEQGIAVVFWLSSCCHDVPGGRRDEGKVVMEIHKHKQHKRIGIYHCRLDKAANRNWLMAIKSIPDSDRFV